jgi:hypothetical protein
MKDGSFIKRISGESLAQAVRRISTPRVMFVTVDLEKNKIMETKQSYCVEKQGAWISEYESEEDELLFAVEDDAPLDANWYGTVETDEELKRIGVTAR